MSLIGQRMEVEIRQSQAGAVELRNALMVLLFQYDPIQISYETNSEEYAPEAGNISARLGACLGPQDVCRVIYEELVRSFGTEAVGAMQECEQLASDAWLLWLRFCPVH